MSQKIKTSVEIDGSLSASQIANATTDTDKFLVSDGGTIKYRTGAELATDLGISAGTTSKVQHQVKAGVAINKGQAVYTTGANGTNIIVGLASNASEATSSKTMGLLNATVATNGFADVITEGLLDGLNTTAATIGDPIWLGTGGNLIYGLANKPYAPNHLVFIGIVTRVHANQGEIFVKVQNGFELDEIHDVDLKTTAKINGHLLGYNGSLWVNKTIAEWLGYTPYNASNPAGYISTYTETDTLASVTARGALTNTPIAISSGTLNHVTIADRFNLIGGSNFHITNNAYYDSGFKYKFADLATKLALQADGILSYQTAATGTIGAAVTFDTRFSIDSAGNLLSTGSMLSPIFYDSNNTGYYLDIASYSKINQLSIGTVNNAYALYNNGNSYFNGAVEVDDTLYVSSGYSARAPIFYDIDNTAYYVDPASTSNLNGLTLAGTFSAPGYNKTNWDTAYGWGNHAGLYLGINSKAADSELLDGIDSSRVIYGDNSTGTISISDATLNGALKSGFYTVGTGGIPNATSVNFVLHTAYNGVGNAAGFDLACNDSTTSSFYLRPATGGGKGSWQTIVTSANVGSYAVPSSRTITINGTSYDLSANRSWTVTASETDTLATVTGRGSTTSTGVGFNNYVNILGQNSVYWYNSSNTSYARTYFDGGTFNLDKSLWVTANIYGDIFYDRNNTAYYLNPNGQSIFGGGDQYVLGLQHSAAQGDFVDALFLQNSESGGRVQIGMSSNGSDGQHHRVSLRAYKGSGNYEGTFGIALRQADTSNVQKLTLTSAGNLTVSPGGTSGAYYLSDTSAGLYRDNSYDVVLTQNNSSGNVLYMAGAGDVRVSIDSNDNDTGNRFIVGNNAVKASNELFSVNESGTAFASSDFRAPIFYDSGNTSYYWNPNTSSGHRFQTPTGYLDLGSMNGSWCHFQTDRPNFYFGSGVHVNGGVTIYGTSSYLDSGRVQAPAFYDSNDTSYYVDPAGNGARAAVLNGNLWITPKSESYGEGVTFNMPNQATWGGLRWYRNGSAGGYSGNWAFGYFGNESNNDVGFHNGTNGWRLDHSFNMTSTGSVRSNIFYDSNDTGYYWNPATDTSHRFQTPYGYIDIGPKNSGTCHIYTDRPSFYFNQTLLVNGNTVWHGGNDGSGSGLDADLIDGIESSRIVYGDGASKISSHSNANDWRDSGFYQNDGGGSNWPSGTWMNSINVRHSNQGNYHGFQVAMSYYDNNLWFRSYQGSGSFQGWQRAAVARSEGTNYIDHSRYVYNNGAYSGSGWVEPSDLGVRYALNSTNAGNADTVDGFHGDTFFRNLGFGSGYPSWNANTIDESRSGFTYANGAPHSGCIAHFGASGYGIQLNGNYGGDTFAMRSRNGDNGTWRPWKTLYTDYNMDAPNKSGTSYYQTNTWMQFNGAYGLYWPGTYGAHFHPNDATSYTQFRLQGSKNGYGGIYDTYSAVNGMMYDGAGNGGVYREANGRWFWYHHVSNNCTGISTSSTSSSYRAYIGGSLYAEGDIVAYSDRRKKENIVTVDGALDKVNKLRGVYYNRIDDDAKKRQVGVIAQEIQEILPEVVTYAEDVDEYGVSYGNITGLLIEAIKEQQAQIEELKELVKTLINK